MNVVYVVLVCVLVHFGTFHELHDFNFQYMENQT